MQDTALLDTLHDITTKHTVTFELSVGLQERSLHAGIQIRSHVLKQGHFPQSRTGEIHVSAQSRSAGGGALPRWAIMYTQSCPSVYETSQICRRSE